MKHPSQEILALHAGGDLSWIARWKTARHLAGCERCTLEVAEFGALREVLPELNQIPEVPWNRIAADMRANIRLGLAAGECVRSTDRPLRDSPSYSPLFSGARATVALASVLALMVTGLMLEGPAPRLAQSNEPMVQATADGIQRRSGDQSFGLMHSGGLKVTYTVGAQGTLGARYTDPETGNVTMTKVYVE
jgi:anti-sigma factor RsiW